MKLNVNEATIMEQTRHRSTDGVRAYRRSNKKLNELPSNVLDKIAKIEVKPALVTTGTENKPLPESLASTVSLNAVC